MLSVKDFLIIVAVFAIMFLTVIVVGVSLPVQHTVTRAAVYRESPEILWRAIDTPAEFPAWRKTVTRVALGTSPDGKLAWTEYDRHGRPIPYEAVETDPPRKLVTRITNPKLPFGGTWTFEITPQGAGAELRITETGEIPNPFFRFMARYVYGYRSTLNTYLDALGRKFGETVTFED